MDDQPRKKLTLIKLMSLVALLGIVLTIAVSMWQRPTGADSAGTDAEQTDGSSQTQ